MWRTLHSLLHRHPRQVSTAQNAELACPARASAKPQAASPKRDGQPPGSKASRTPVIALLVSDHDREVLARISDQESLDVHFPETRVEAWDDMNRLSSPVILYDRDWPNAEWRTTVHSFATSTQRPCVILTSRVADEYLWQELIRWGGHDLVAKPLRPGDVSRALKLALSYWKSARASAK